MNSSTWIDIWATMLLAYLITYVIACVVMARRSQQAIWHRVQQTGRPVSGAFAFGYLAWSLVKAWVWPLTLAIWLARDRPAPGTFQRPRDRWSPLLLMAVSHDDDEIALCHERSPTREAL